MTAVPADKPQGAFSPRVVLTLIVVGVVAFAGFLVLSTYAPDIDGGRRDGGGHALSRSAVGFAAIERLVNAAGSPTVISRDATPPTTGLWVLTPPVGATFEERLDALSGPVLIVLPKWDVQADPERPGWVRNGGPTAAEGLSQLMGLLSPNAEPSPDGKPDALTTTIARRSGRERVSLIPDGDLFEPSNSFVFSGVDRLQTLEGGTLLPLLTDETGRVVLAQLPAPRQQVYVLSDPDLLNTRGLREAADARAAVVLLRSLAGGQAVTFDVTLHGFERGRGILRTAFEPPFLGATLCLLAAAILMGVHAAVRFGPAARPGRVFALGKAALAENAAGLIALAGREAAMAPAYAADSRAAVASAIGAPKTLTGGELDAFLDRTGEALGAAERWTSLDGEARAAGSPDGALDIARRIGRWRMEITRGRR